MTLAKAIKVIKKSDSLIVTPKVYEFLRAYPDGVRWDDEGYELWRDLTQRAMGNEDRSGRFGASGRGKCLRAQIFGFIGMPAMKMIDGETQNMFNDGKWRHLRWQMMLLQSGAITHAEYPYSAPKYRVSGSMDGLNSYDSWGLELKGDRNWSRVLDGIPEEHNLQIHTMMLATGWDKFVYLVESKSNNDWREIIVRRDPKIIQQVKDELEELNDHVERRTLPEILPACEAGEGPYRTCPFARGCRDRHNRGEYWWPAERDWDT